MLNMRSAKEKQNQTTTPGDQNDGALVLATLPRVTALYFNTYSTDFLTEINKGSPSHLNHYTKGHDKMIAQH